MPETFHLYRRKSTSDDQPNTLQIQDGWADDQCRRNNWTRGKTYTDQGQPSDSLNRPALRELLEDIAVGKVRLFGVNRHDRLARGDIFLTILAFCKAHECEVVMGDAPPEMKDAGVMIGFWTGYDKYFLNLLRERTAEGLEYVKSQGKVKVGRPVLGFKWVKGRLMPEAWVAELERQLEGKTLYQIEREKTFVQPHGKKMRGRPLSYKALKRIATYAKAHRDGTLETLIAAETRKSLDRINIVSAIRAEEEKEFRVWLAQHTPSKVKMR